MAEGLALDRERGRLLEGLEAKPNDSLLALIGMVRRDPREHKIDLGVGVYKDAAGNTPILRAVKKAERILNETQETKAYLGGEGDVRFVELMREMIFGPGVSNDSRFIGLQTVGGCGALRLGAELVHLANPDARIFVGQPTWPNHVPLIGSVGVPMVEHPFYDRGGCCVLFDEMMASLQSARPGDLILVHGCAHNPTGADLTWDQWQALADFISARGVIPFIDFAYQGLGYGLEQDARGTRLLVDAADQAIVAHSNDKNFGVYRDRVGSLHVKAPTPEVAEIAYSNLQVIARTIWSMPPDHGAAVVRLILDTPDLSADWHAEIKEMCARIRSLRRRLADFDPRLEYIDMQNGMFSMLPLTPDSITELRESEAIYMAGSGRFNVAGLSDDNVERFASAVVERLPA